MVFFQVGANYSRVGSRVSCPARAAWTQTCRVIERRQCDLWMKQLSLEKPLEYCSNVLTWSWIFICRLFDLWHVCVSVGYDGGSSDSECESPTLDEHECQSPPMPDFWLIVKIQQDRVKVYSHSRSDSQQKPRRGLALRVILYRSRIWLSSPGAWRSERAPVPRSWRRRWKIRSCLNISDCIRWWSGGSGKSVGLSIR